MTNRELAAIALGVVVVATAVKLKLDPSIEDQIHRALLRKGGSQDSVNKFMGAVSRMPLNDKRDVLKILRVTSPFQIQRNPKLKLAYDRIATEYRLFN